MSSVREILDPNHTLPDVHLETRSAQDFGYMTRSEVAIMEAGAQVGHCGLITEIHSDSRFAHFDDIEIHNENNRGRGIGLATYVLAIEAAHSQGFDFETQNWELTRHSKKIWEYLAAKSVAQVIKPFEPSPDLEHTFVGKYRVPIIR